MVAEMVQKSYILYVFPRIARTFNAFTVEMFQNTCKMTTKDKQKEEDFKNGFLEMAKALSELQDRAVEAYRPLVNDICNRKAKEDEVEDLLTWMFDFVENEQMLLLFKKVCRTYLYTYPEVVGFYIME